jgi:colicin import membrane protein
MSQRFSNAIVASALLHGAAIALIIAATYLAGLRSGKSLEFFELVAGEGDNFGATEAPALGTAGGDPAVVTQPVPVAATTVIAPAPAAPKEKDLTQVLKSSAAKATAKVAAQAAKERAAEEKAAKEEAARQAREEAAAKQAMQQGRMSKEEFDRLYKNKATPAAAPKTNVPKVGVGLAGGVVGGSAANTKGGAGGTALTAPERSVAEAYTSALMQRLQQNLDDQKPPGLSDTLMATASMRILADGTISGATIVKPSGNREFDKAVLDAIRLTRMSARPKGFTSDTVIIDFSAKDKSGQ